MSRLGSAFRSHQCACLNRQSDGRSRRAHTGVKNRMCNFLTRLERFCLYIYVFPVWEVTVQLLPTQTGAWPAAKHKNELMCKQQRLNYRFVFSRIGELIHLGRLRVRENSLTYGLRNSKPHMHTGPFISQKRGRREAVRLRIEASAT